MNVAMEIAIGSSLQIILFVTPILVFVSLFFKPMSIIFDNFELIALYSGQIIANKVSIDGESNWLEGLVLIGIYFILAVMFFFFSEFTESLIIYLIDKIVMFLLP